MVTEYLARIGLLYPKVNPHTILRISLLLQHDNRLSEIHVLGGVIGIFYIRKNGEEGGGEECRTGN